MIHALNIIKRMNKKADSISGPMLMGLKKYIDAAFNNEDRFLKDLFPEFTHYSLIECHLSDETAKVIVLNDDGRTVSTSVSIKDFINWVDSLQDDT